MLLLPLVVLLLPPRGLRPPYTSSRPGQRVSRSRRQGQALASRLVALSHCWGATASLTCQLAWISGIQYVVKQNSGQFTPESEPLVKPPWLPRQGRKGSNSPVLAAERGQSSPATGPACASLGSGSWSSRLRPTVPAPGSAACPLQGRGLPNLLHGHVSHSHSTPTTRTHHRLTHTTHTHYIPHTTHTTCYTIHCIPHAYTHARTLYTTTPDTLHTAYMTHTIYTSHTYYTHYMAHYTCYMPHACTYYMNTLRAIPHTCTRILHTTYMHTHCLYTVNHTHTHYTLHTT